MYKISVIVPVYNVEKYIKKCLDSLVNQTLKDIEIIVVNDGSPDNSQKIIDKYTKKYKNIKSFIKENGGLSDARNYGIKKATGEYISFIDSDDYIKEDMLEKMYIKAKETNSDIIVCDFIKLYEDGKEILTKSNLNYSDDNIKNYLLSPPMACTRLINKKVIEKVEFKKNIYYEDLELMPKLIKHNKKVDFLEEGLYYYLQRSGSIMKQNVFNEKLLDIFTVLDSNYKELYNKYPEEIEYMYITHLLRTASLRFLDYENNKLYNDKICDIINKRFPNWKKNQYYKKSSYKLKILCNLAYYKKRNMLKLIKRIFKY